jgi:Flavodoxin domain
MWALVIYESMYGNTAAIAAEIAAGLDDTHVEVTLRNVDDVAPSDAAGYDVLVVGGPTHAHGMTRATTRKTAVQDRENTYDDPTVGDGLRALLAELAPGEPRAAAAFDTRIDIPAVLSGAASKGIAGALTGHGFRLVVPRQSFLVSKENTLLDGERERARAWGGTIATSLALTG